MLKQVPREIDKQVDPRIELQAGEHKAGEPKRAASLLGGFLRFAGATAGFMVGGPAGAAIGSVMGELAGDIAAERTSLIPLALGRAWLFSRGAYGDENARDGSRDDGRHP